MQTAFPDDTRGRFRSTAIWLMVSLGFCVSLASLYPGHYSFDSAYQLWQARTGAFSNVTPVPMIALWALLLDVFGNPASLLFLNLAMFWAGVGLCFHARALPLSLTLAGVAICGLSPLVLIQMGHLISDAHMSALLVLATGLLASHRPGGARTRLWMAVALIVYAGCIRQNALVAIIPLGAVATWMLAPTPMRRARLVVAGATATALLAVAASVAFDRALAVERRPLWPMLVIWDLAALSVATDDLLLPPFTHGSGLDASELRETGAFDPASAAPLFSRSHSGMKSGLEDPFTPEERKELARAWWTAVRDHPRIYLAHRAKTMAMLIGRHDAMTAGLAYYPVRTTYRDNPALPEIWNPPAYHRLIRLADGLRLTWVFSALPYLIVHVILLILAWRRRSDPRAVIVLGVTSSALAYAASFLLLAPSVELRFMTWPIISAPLSLFLWFAPIRIHWENKLPN